MRNKDFLKQKLREFIANKKSPARKITRCSLGRRKMIQVRHSNLHRERKNVREGKK